MCSTDKTMAPNPQRQRRINKPLMERKRRERINQCLNELKTLVLKAQKKDLSRFTKLEKADILEMTVYHVKSLHEEEKATTPRLNEDMEKYRLGFAKCVSEVNNFMQGIEGMSPQLCCRIVSHLNNIILKLSNKKDGTQLASKIKCQAGDQVPLASLENKQGFLTISRNVNQCKGRTVSINTLSNLNSNKIESLEWYPSSLAANESLESRLSSQEPESSFPKQTQTGRQQTLPFPIEQSPQNYQNSTNNLQRKGKEETNVTSTQHPPCSFQDVPLNLATTQRGPNGDEIKNSQRTKNANLPSTPPHSSGHHNHHYFHSFPPSPPSSASSSPEPIPDYPSSHSLLGVAHSSKRPNQPGNFIATQLASTAHWRPW